MFESYTYTYSGSRQAHTHASVFKAGADNSNVNACCPHQLGPINGRLLFNCAAGWFAVQASRYTDVLARSPCQPDAGGWGASERRGSVAPHGSDSTLMGLLLAEGLELEMLVWVTPFAVADADDEERAMFCSVPAASGVEACGDVTTRPRVDSGLFAVYCCSGCIHAVRRTCSACQLARA
eukprot:364942-Chlamydomonas_euryale.AAC.18